MSQPEDAPQSGDDQRGNVRQDMNEIDRIVAEIRESPGTDGASEAGADTTEVSDEAERGQSPARDLHAAGAFLTVRPGPLAPVRRRAKALVHRAVHSQVRPIADQVSRLSTLHETEVTLHEAEVMHRGAEVAEHAAIVSELRRELAGVKDRLSRVERMSRSQPRTASMVEPPASRAGDVEVAGQSVVGQELDYFAFEGLLRGSTDEIAARQLEYVEVFADTDDILDVGCGRGELVELLVAAGKRAAGVDLNHDMVEACRDRGLQVTVADGIVELAGRPAQSLGGVAALQVVEHLRPGQLTTFLASCHRVLRPGGVLLLETINPVTLSAIRNYFADLTHAQPLVPETLRFLVESAGFREVAIAYKNPLPEIARLRHVPYDDRASLSARAESDRNVDLVNATLFGPQDYAVIARA